jgi:hypothetical protein
MVVEALLGLRPDIQNANKLRYKHHRYNMVVESLLGLRPDIQNANKLRYKQIRIEGE